MNRPSMRALFTSLTLLAACSTGDGAATTTDDLSASAGGEATHDQATDDNEAPVAGVLGRAPTPEELAGLMAPDAPLPPDDAERVAMPIDGAPARGAASPSVTIVVFSDFQCPFCGRLEPTLARLRSAYPDDVAVVFRHLPLPFHVHAHEAAELSEIAYDLGGNDAFWRVHDLLFQNQRELDREALLRYANAAGLDVREVERRLESGTTRARVDESARMAARVGATGTPTSFINGRPLVGAQPYERFDEIVQEERALAAQEARQGLGRRGLYARRIAGAQASITRDDPPPSRRRAPAPDVVYRVPVTTSQPSLGPADALVTIVEFSDFQCPFCSRVEPTLRALRERYGDDLRIVWRNNPLPFHNHAHDAAVLGLEALEQGGNEAFWRMHGVLFENQRALDDLDSLALQGQIDVSKFRRALAQRTHDAAIEADITAARQLGSSGTPAFFINGRNLRGAQPLQAFTAAVDRALGEARAELARGTARADVYEALTRDGVTSPPPQPAAPRAGAPDPGHVYDVAVPSDAPSRGPVNAPVVIQQFSDFQCPFCQRVEPTLARLREIYGERVRFVWRNYPLPFHEHAAPAAVAAMEVFRQGGSDRFWAYHDILFAHRQEMTDDNLVEWASQLRGIRGARVRRALGDAAARRRVDSEMDPMRAAGARIGTPAFLINGRLLQGAQPLDTFRRAIDLALREAGQEVPDAD